MLPVASPTNRCKSCCSAVEADALQEDLHKQKSASSPSQRRQRRGSTLFKRQKAFPSIAITQRIRRSLEHRCLRCGAHGCTSPFCHPRTLSAGDARSLRMHGKDTLPIFACRLHYMRLRIGLSRAILPTKLRSQTNLPCTHLTACAIIYKAFCLGG